MVQCRQISDFSGTVKITLHPHSSLEGSLFPNSMYSTIFKIVLKICSQEIQFIVLIPSKKCVEQLNFIPYPDISLIQDLQLV